VTWASWDAFWSMGGYGLYVWGSYAMVAAVVAVEVWLVNSRKRAAAQEARNSGARAGSSQ
jgi:heme exporter protein D